MGVHTAGDDARVDVIGDIVSLSWFEARGYRTCLLTDALSFSFSLVPWTIPPSLSLSRALVCVVMPYVFRARTTWAAGLIAPPPHYDVPGLASCALRLAVSGLYEGTSTSHPHAPRSTILTILLRVRVRVQSYLNPNGLKYHLEKGTCTNADARPRGPLPPQEQSPAPQKTPALPSTVKIDVIDVPSSRTVVDVDGDADDGEEQLRT